MKMLRILFIVILFFTTTFASAQVEWLSFEEAVEKTKSDPKPIFIDVYTDWCGWCKKMDAATFSEDKIAAMLQNDFYPVKFDAEQQESINFNNHEFKFIANGRKGYNELAVALLDGKLSYPSVVFLNEKMERITVLAGYRGPDDFYPILQFIGSGAYQNKTFEEYQKEL